MHFTVNHFFSCLIFNHILRSAYYSCPEVGRSRCVAGSDVHHLQPAQPLHFVSVGSKHFVVYHSHFILLVHSSSPILLLLVCCPPFSVSASPSRSLSPSPRSVSPILLLIHSPPLSFLFASPPLSSLSFLPSSHSGSSLCWSPLLLWSARSPTLSRRCNRTSPGSRGADSVVLLTSTTSTNPLRIRPPS